jgi:hypothetical protein
MGGAKMAGDAEADADLRRIAAEVIERFALGDAAIERVRPAPSADVLALIRVGSARHLIKRRDLGRTLAVVRATQRLQHELRQGGFPVPVLARAPDGEALAGIDGAGGSQAWYEVQGLLRGERPSWRRDHDCRAAGALLARLHATPLGSGVPASKFVADRRRWLIEPLERLRRRYPQAREIAVLIDGMAAPWAQAAPVLTHGDFQADNLLSDERGLQLIDLDEAGGGDAAIDLSLFLRRLDGDTAGARAFLVGYLPGTALSPSLALGIRARSLGWGPEEDPARLLGWLSSCGIG